MKGDRGPKGEKGEKGGPGPDGYKGERGLMVNYTLFNLFIVTDRETLERKATREILVLKAIQEKGASK